MKLQLTKDKTIDVKMPWEKGPSAGGAAKKGGGLSDVTGISLFDGDARGCPAVRLQKKKDGIFVSAVGFVKPPKHNLATSWEESKNVPAWDLPVMFQAPQAALAVTSKDMFIRQTTQDALLGEGKGGVEEAPKKKKLGIKRDVEPSKTAPAKASAAIVPYVPVSKDGMRFVTSPLADESFILQSGMPEYQVLWLSRLLPEGKRPTAYSVQISTAAMLSSLCEHPELVKAEGNAVAVFVTNAAVYFAGYKKGELVLFRECPDAAGYEVMKELVKSGLGVGDELVDEILEDTLIDPRPALEPLVRPVLRQLRLSLDYLAQRHDVHTDKVFLMGLPAGAMYWSQLAQESIGVEFISPGVFDGCRLSGKAGAVVEGLTARASQVFLSAFGAARAAMEG